MDPYNINLSAWDQDVKTWPDVEYGDIANYFVCAVSCYTCTFDGMKAYKAMDSYNYFASGWVSKVGCLYIKKVNLESFLFRLFYQS